MPKKNLNIIHLLKEQKRFYKLRNNFKAKRDYLRDHIFHQYCSVSLPKHERCNLSQFADDLAIYTIYNKKKEKLLGGLRNAQKMGSKNKLTKNKNI